MRHVRVLTIMTSLLINLKEKSMKLRWQQGYGVAGKSCRIPTTAGLYAYGVVERVCGLVKSVEWVYVGQGTNLRRRITSHDPRYETNSDLQMWLRKPPAGAELWLVEVPNEDLDSAERAVIAGIQPKFNTNHINKKGK